MRQLRYGCSSLLLVLAYPTLSFAQVFNAGGLAEGVGTAAEIKGPVNTTLRVFVLNILYVVLNFVALAAIVAIVIAGIIMVVSGGNEEQKERAKRIILYAVIGLLIIFFARMIVSFFVFGVFFR